MAEITRLSGGQYAICGLGRLPFLVLSARQMRDLLEAMADARLIVLDTASSRVTLR